MPRAVTGEVVAAVGAGECVWLGFQALDRADPVTVRVRVYAREPIDAVTGEPWADALAAGNHLVCPPDTSLAGVAGPHGRRAFGTEPVEQLTLLADGAAVTVRLVPFDAFERLTGESPSPLDPDSAYKGWRLP